MLHFEHPPYLYALLALPLLAAIYFLYRRWQHRKLMALGDPRLIARQLPALDLRTGRNGKARLRSRSRTGLRAALLLLTAALLTAGWAALRGKGEAVSIKSRSVDVILALDVSKSMLATDVPPSRIDRARQCLLLLLNKLQGHRVGLILFAGRAYLQSPITTDYGMLRTILQTVGPGDVPTGGTAIGEAIKLAGISFSTKERTQKVLLILSDGETHDARATAGVQDLRKAGVLVSTVGIGSPEGVTITDPVTGAPITDEDGSPVVSRLDEAGLAMLARAGGGSYTRLRGSDRTATAIATALNGIHGEGDMKGSEFDDFKQYYAFFLAPALLLLLLDGILSTRALRKQPATPLVS